MPLGSFFNCRFRIVNDCDEPVAVPPKIKYHIPLNIVGVLERAANLRKIMPSNPSDDSHPCLDLVRRIRVLLHSLAQMLARHDVHRLMVLHNMLSCQMRLKGGG